MTAKKEKKVGPYEQFQTSAKDETQGVVVDYGTFVIVIKRAGPTNKAFARATRKIQDKYGRKIELGVMEDDALDQVFVDMFAETIVQDWRGVTDAKGDELPFTVENCIKLLTDLPELYKDLQGKALSYKTFRSANFEETVKN